MRRIATLLVVACAAACLAVGCGGDDDAAPAETTGTTTTETTGTGEEPAGDATAGQAVFASAGCGGCHILAAAGSTGTVGPSLDETSPSFDKVAERVAEGKGVMPSFADQLSEQEIRDVAAFVSGAVGG